MDQVFYIPACYVVKCDMDFELLSCITNNSSGGGCLATNFVAGLVPRQENDNLQATFLFQLVFGLVKTQP